MLTGELREHKEAARAEKAGSTEVVPEVGLVQPVSGCPQPLRSQGSTSPYPRWPLGTLILGPRLPTVWGLFLRWGQAHWIQPPGAHRAGVGGVWKSHHPTTAQRVGDNGFPPSPPTSGLVIGQLTSLLSFILTPCSLPHPPAALLHPAWTLTLTPAGRAAPSRLLPARRTGEPRLPGSCRLPGGGTATG